MKKCFQSLVTLSSKGPIQAELVSMMLRWLSEDITVHNEDLEGDRRRLLLRWVTQSLPETLPLLHTLLEKHCTAALSEASRKQIDVAKLHAAAVTATLNAVIAYAEWAPLTDLAKSGIINLCGFLLSAPEFRLHASEFFKLVSSRKRSVDASASEIDQVMRDIFQILMNISREFLHKSGSGLGSMDESEYDFSECICESMVSLGSFNLQSIAGDSAVFSLYLEQMLGFFKNYKFAIHFQSLQFWLVLMRDLTPKPRSSTHSACDSPSVSCSGSENAKKKDTFFTFSKENTSLLSDDFCSAMLDTSFLHILKREKTLPGTALSLVAPELWSDDFEDKGQFIQYRYSLLELIRFVASYKPLIAAAKVSEKIDTIIKSFLLSPSPSQDLAAIESMPLALENVVNAVFGGSNDMAEENAEVQLELCRTFEGLLQQFISLKWTEPALVEVLVHYLDAMCLFLKYSPDAAGSVINKLFELLTSLPLEIKETSTSSARHARLHICSSFIRIAKATDKSILPHLKVHLFKHPLYNVLGLSITIGDSFFKNLDVHFVAVALMENIQSMEFSHLRELVHCILIPLVKNGPVDMREIWLEKLLHPLFDHVQQALSCSWSSLLQDGRAKVPDTHGILSGSDLKVQVMEETLLRNLTRQICSLLSVIASPPLNTGIPSLEQSGHIIPFDMSSVKSLDAVASCSLVGFLLKHEGLALPTLRMCLEVFKWTDGEAVTKISSFCSAMVVLSTVTNHTKLVEYVSTDLFTSVIQGLELELNAIISADLVEICREIFVYLGDRHPAPRKVLQSLPFITSRDLHAFEESLSKTSSPKEQRQHMKNLLLMATGNKLKALAEQKRRLKLTGARDPDNCC
ncbi:protein HASTY 1 [Medicago truncatula]|uniref:protein HASTY 1 n=1 Tax=Medicago truncatula TaxID=3880 RepID=UPI001967DDC7|nr:protein HASTY 1 [Medicago truncatula]